MSKTAQQPAFVTVAEAAKTLGVHEATVRRAIRSGALEAVQLRNRRAVRIPQTALEPREAT